MLSHEEVKRQAHELVDEYFECAFGCDELEKRANKLGEENNAEKIVNDVLAETGAGEMLWWYHEMLKRRVMAEPYAEAYCRANGLSVEKLKTQRFVYAVDDSEMVYEYRTKLNLEKPPYSLPHSYPTLMLHRNEKGGYDVEPTEYTRKYLAE